MRFRRNQPLFRQIKKRRIWRVWTSYLSSCLPACLLIDLTQGKTVSEGRQKHRASHHTVLIRILRTTVGYFFQLHLLPDKLSLLPMKVFSSLFLVQSALGFMPASLKATKASKTFQTSLSHINYRCYTKACATAHSHQNKKIDSSLFAEASEICSNNGDFDRSAALFCAGLAFDAYSEPPPNSSRWERGVSSAKVQLTFDV